MTFCRDTERNRDFSAVTVRAGSNGITDNIAVLVFGNKQLIQFAAFLEFADIRFLVGTAGHNRIQSGHF